jgi:ATPase subunit of ABC transporter with duplicated ATPase domains
LQIKGKNGSGKSTLIKLIIGELKPQAGEIYLNGKAIYVNQNLDLLDGNKTILDNMIDYNSGIKIEEAHAILANFKFRNIQADKLVSTLSGGELLRASLATVLGTQNQPDMIILDEPTNNLDIESIEILETALSQYQGAVIVVSHDEEFIKNIGVTKMISL